MKKKIEKAFTLIAALSRTCVPILLIIVGFLMIYYVGLWIGLELSAVEYGMGMGVLLFTYVYGI